MLLSQSANVYVYNYRTQNDLYVSIKFYQNRTFITRTSVESKGIRRYVSLIKKLDYTIKIVSNVLPLIHIIETHRHVHTVDMVSNMIITVDIVKHSVIQ